MMAKGMKSRNEARESVKKEYVRQYYSTAAPQMVPTQSDSEPMPRTCSEKYYSDKTFEKGS